MPKLLCKFKFKFKVLDGVVAGCSRSEGVQHGLQLAYSEGLRDEEGHAC